MSRSEFFAVFCASVKAIKSSLVPMIKSLSVPVSSCEFQRAAVTPIDPMWNVLYFSELFWAFLNPFESQLASVCLNPFVSRVSCKVRWVPVNPRESQISLCETFYVPVSRNEILFSFSWIQRGLCTTFFEWKLALESPNELLWYLMCPNESHRKLFIPTDLLRTV